MPDLESVPCPMQWHFSSENYIWMCKMRIQLCRGGFHFSNFIFYIKWKLSHLCHLFHFISYGGQETAVVEIIFNRDLKLVISYYLFLSCCIIPLWPTRLKEQFTPKYHSICTEAGGCQQNNCLQLRPRGEISATSANGIIKK